MYLIVVVKIVRNYVTNVDDTHYTAQQTRDYRHTNYTLQIFFKHQKVANKVNYTYSVQARLPHRAYLVIIVSKLPR